MLLRLQPPFTTLTPPRTLVVLLCSAKSVICAVICAEDEPASRAASADFSGQREPRQRKTSLEQHCSSIYLHINSIISIWQTRTSLSRLTHDSADARVMHT